jgi:hypothetical protein
LLAAQAQISSTLSTLQLSNHRQLFTYPDIVALKITDTIFLFFLFREQQLTIASLTP